MAVLGEARARDRAPATLRARVERERARDQDRRRRGLFARPRTFAGALAAGVACVAVLLALILPVGTAGTPTIAQAADLSLRGPAGPAPAIVHQGQANTLGASVSEVYFPDWHAELGWRAVGQRTDTLSGRRAVTVFYQRGSERVAYTIVATPPLPVPNAQPVRAGTLTVKSLNTGQRATVTWRRSGATCVLSSTDLDAHQLAALAAWTA